MPLAELMSVPDAAQLAGWQFANVSSHRDIIRRVQETTGVQLVEYPLEFDPQDPNSLNNFLNSHADMHQAMDRALGLNSYALNEVDWTDINDLSRWIQAHAIEHLAASQILGVS